MSEEFESEAEANPGTTAVYSADDTSAPSDLTANLRATIGDDDAPSSSFAGQQGQAEAPQYQQYTAPSGREGQADAGGGYPPPVPSAISAREVMASMGMPIEHYPDDRAALNDLLTNVYQSQQQLQQAARQVEALQQHARMLQQQQAQPQATPQAQGGPPSRPQWKPDFADIQIVDSENGEKRYISKSTGLSVAPETVQGAIAYAQSRDEFLRDLYEKPEQAMAPIVSEAVQQAMQQFQQYQAQQSQQQQYQQNLQSANDYVVQTFGDTLFQPGPYGPNLQQPTPLGYQYLQILEQMPQNIPPMDKARFAANQLAVQIMSARPQAFSQMLNGQQQMPQQQYAPAPPPMSQGDQQRQALRRTAYRNPSVSSPSANGTSEAFFESPDIDIREKLRQAMFAN
jgi:prefoldin subunit 5